MKNVFSCLQDKRRQNLSLLCVSYLHAMHMSIKIYSTYKFLEWSIKEIYFGHWVSISSTFFILAFVLVVCIHGIYYVFAANSLQEFALYFPCIFFFFEYDKHSNPQFNGFVAHFNNMTRFKFQLHLSHKLKI